MAILSHEEIILAKKKGLISFDDSFNVGATSLDVKVEQLYKRKTFESSWEALEAIELPDKEFKEKYLEPVPIENNECWLLSSNEYYIAELAGDYYFDPFIKPIVTSRSSWARLGVLIQEISSGLTTPGNVYKGKIQIAITTLGTNVKLRPYDSPAQFTIRTLSDSDILLKDDIIKYLKERKLIVKRGNKILTEVNSKGSIQITLDKHIKVYKGGIMDPQKPVDKFFKEIELTNDGYLIPKYQFFTSASKEYVKIPEDLIGFLHITDYKNPFPKPVPIGPEGIATMLVHANASRIDPYPYFKGKITLENYPFVDIEVYPGQDMTTLSFLKQVSMLKYSRKYKSRYHGQNKVQNSKSYLKR